MLLIGDVTERMMLKLEAGFTIHKLSEIADVSAYLSENGAAIEAVATDGHLGVPEEIMNALPALKVISSYGVGYDAIDTQAAVDRGIIVAHTPEVLNNDVADMAILLMLAVSRCLVRDDAWVRSGNWSKKGAAPLARSIENKKVGIVGLGRIGETIATKLQAFSCEIYYHNRNKKEESEYTYFASLPDMAEAVDYLVIITPGGVSTLNLVNRDVLEALGPEGTLINVGRGSVVDEEALVSALQEGRLGWAGLDVFADEPNAPQALFDMDNVVLTPHIASATVETRQAMGDLTVENLIRFFSEGKVTTPVPECRHMNAAN